MPANTAIASNTDPLTHPIRKTAQLTTIRAPNVVELPLVLEMVAFAGDERGHDDPFRDRGPMDARRRRDGDVAVFDDRVVDPAVDAGGEEVDEFEAVFFWYYRLGLGLDRKDVNKTHLGAASLFGGIAVSVISNVADLKASAPS